MLKRLKTLGDPLFWYLFDCMILLAVFLLIMSSGCGAPPPEFTCPGTGFASVGSNVPLNCPRFLALSLASRHALVDSATVPEARLLALRERTTVWVHDSATFGPDDLRGHHDGLGFHIELGEAMDSLAHEELHGWDTATGQLLTTWHDGWDRNGYTGLVDFARWVAGSSFQRCDLARELTETQRAALGPQVSAWERETCQ